MTRAYLHESVEFILHKKQSWSHRGWSVDQNSHLQEANRRTTQCSYVTVPVIISTHTGQCLKCWLVLGNSLHAQPRCNEVRREWNVLSGLAKGKLIRDCVVLLPIFKSCVRLGWLYYGTDWGHYRAKFFSGNFEVAQQTGWSSSPTFFWQLTSS